MGELQDELSKENFLNCKAFQHAAVSALELACSKLHWPFRDKYQVQEGYFKGSSRKPARAGGENGSSRHRKHSKKPSWF